MKIKAITLCSDSAPDANIFYCVGKYGTTEIILKHKNGEMAPISYYEIFNEKGLFAEVHHYSHVEYFQDDSNPEILKVLCLISKVNY